MHVIFYINSEANAFKMLDVKTNYGFVSLSMTEEFF